SLSSKTVSVVCVYFALLAFVLYILLFFFLQDPAPTELYTLSLHDALPILVRGGDADAVVLDDDVGGFAILEDLDDDRLALAVLEDRKSTRLNSSHVKISYAVFCLKKKKNYIVI